MAEDDRARRMEEQQRARVKMCGVEEINEEERSSKRNLKKKEKSEPIFRQEWVRIRGQQEGELYSSQEGKEVKEGMQDSFNTKYTCLE